MDQTTVPEVIEEFRKALDARGVSVQQIVLFGSHAYGQPHEGSDIDLAVISEDFREMDQWSRIELLSEVIADVWQPIDAVAKTPEEWDDNGSIIVAIAKQGKVMYEAQ
ncbi:MAG: nucleotidyltransferase domain-containing protein [Candidatus Hydrogenedentes bacterium]|nr:nucleotidyltransferase domain-containing protein [Candidatus Hydrogenedentota bacterium]